MAPQQALISDGRTQEVPSAYIYHPANSKNEDVCNIDFYKEVLECYRSIFGTGTTSVHYRIFPGSSSQTDLTSTFTAVHGEANSPGISERELPDSYVKNISVGLVTNGNVPVAAVQARMREQAQILFDGFMRSLSTTSSLSPHKSASSNRAAAYHFAANFTTQYGPPQVNQRKVLRVLIKNREHLACPDSGSSRNIMSEFLANECGLKIRRTSKDIKQFEIGSGKCISSVGRVRVPVELPGNRLGRKKSWFYVFAICPVPLILGMPFLEEEEILTKNRHMLESCPSELSNISSLLWIGSSRNSNSPRNRLQCSLDGHELEVIADTGSDLNLMSLKCARREGFQIDRRREARKRIRVGDGTETETIGQVYIYNLTLDWRKAPTTTGEPMDINDTVNTPQGTSEETDEPNFGTIFHVLPGLPCDVIFGRDLLDQTDAFNLCPDLSPAQPARKEDLFELNVLISLGPVSIVLPIPRRRRKGSVVKQPDPKETHDDTRHAEMFRRTKREEEIAALPVDLQDRAKIREKSRIRDWDALHKTCIYCSPV